jgi:hypothetical protein
MVCFQTKNPNLGKFWRVLLWKILVYFMTFWSILRQFEIFNDHLVYFVVIWYIFLRFGILDQEKSVNLGKQTPKFAQSDHPVSLTPDSALNCIRPKLFHIIDSRSEPWPISSRIWASYAETDWSRWSSAAAASTATQNFLPEATPTNETMFCTDVHRSGANVVKIKRYE